MIVLIFLIAILALVWVSSLNWRFSVKVALIIIILEGVLRKWVLPQVSDQIYFLKDLVLLGAYLKYYLSSEQKYPFKINGITITMFMAFTWCVFQAFNPNLGSPIVGLLGLKSYFFYIPLMWMLPSLFKAEEELYRFLRNYLLLTIPVCLLAVAQFFSPLSSPINIYAGGHEPTASFAGFNAVRVTGTFPYITGYSVYLTVCFSLLIPLLSVKQPQIWRWLTLAEAFLVVGTSFMTGARGLLLYEVLFIVGYLFIFVLTQPSVVSRATKQLILPTILLSNLIPAFFSKAIDAFYSRAVSSSDSSTFHERAFSAFTEPLEAIRFKGFDGYGTGATHQAVSTLRKVLNLPPGESVQFSERETSRIVLELGPLGFLFWYGLRLFLIFYVWRVFIQLKTRFLRQLALATFLLHLINITSELVFNDTFAIYYWFFSGFIFLLPELEKRQNLSYQYWLNQHHVYSAYFSSSSN